MTCEALGVYKYVGRTVFPENKRSLIRDISLFGVPNNDPFCVPRGLNFSIKRCKKLIWLVFLIPTHKRNAHTLNQIKLSCFSKGQILIYRKQLGQAEFRCANVSPGSRGRVLITDSIFLIIACLFRNDSPQFLGGWGLMDNESRDGPCIPAW